MGTGYITEKGYFILDSRVKGDFAAAYDDVGLDPHSLQFFDAGLGWFGFQLLGCAQIGD